MEISNAVREAARYVLAREAVDGNEHAVLLDAAGKCIFQADGIKNEVEINPPKAIRDLAKTLVHNHPGGGTLSIPDLMNATVTGMEVWAVSADGSFYASRGFARQSDQDLAIYGVGEEAILRSLSRGYAEGKLTYDAQGILGHIINKFFSGRGMFDYRYELSPELQKAYDTNQRSIQDILGAL